jgi:hypothetical protein
MTVVLREGLKVAQPKGRRVGGCDAAGGLEGGRATGGLGREKFLGGIAAFQQAHGFGGGGGPGKQR